MGFDFACWRPPVSSIAKIHGLVFSALIIIAYDCVLDYGVLSLYVIMYMYRDTFVVQLGSRWWWQIAFSTATTIAPFSRPVLPDVMPIIRDVRRYRKRSARKNKVQYLQTISLKTKKHFWWNSDTISARWYLEVSKYQSIFFLWLKDSCG